MADEAVAPKDFRYDSCLDLLGTPFREELKPGFLLYLQLLKRDTPMKRDTPSAAEV